MVADTDGVIQRKRKQAPSLLSLPPEVAVNWFNLSFLGWVILIAALAIAAYKLGAQPVWIAIGALVLLGIGIIISMTHSKPRI